VYCDKLSSDEELLSLSLDVDVAFAASLEPALDIVSVSPCDETVVASLSLLCVADDVEVFAAELDETLLLEKILFVEL
jgi:hypothetical protein